MKISDLWKEEGKKKKSWQLLIHFSLLPSVNNSSSQRYHYAYWRSIGKWVQIQMCKLASANKPYSCIFICANSLPYLHQWPLCIEDRWRFIFCSDFHLAGKKNKPLTHAEMHFVWVVMVLTSSLSFQDILGKNKGRKNNRLKWMKSCVINPWKGEGDKAY